MDSDASVGDIINFLEDNSGAFESMVEFIKDQVRNNSDWKEGLEEYLEGAGVLGNDSQANESVHESAGGKFKVTWKGYPGNPKPETVDANWFDDDMGFDKNDVKEILNLGVGEEWTSGSPMGQDSVKVVRIKESVQIDEKVFDDDKYTWYAWTNARPSQMFDRRGGAKQLEKGMQFGLRPATSKAGTWRMIMKQKGPSIIFSIPEDDAKTLAKSALELR